MGCGFTPSLLSWGEGRAPEWGCGCRGRHGAWGEGAAVTPGCGRPWALGAPMSPSWHRRARRGAGAGSGSARGWCCPRGAAAVAEPGRVEECPGGRGAVLRCVTPFLSVPHSKSVQSKVDSILVSVSAERCAEGVGVARLHLSPLPAAPNPGSCLIPAPVGSGHGRGDSPRDAPDPPARGWHPLPQPCLGQPFPVPARGSSCDSVYPVPPCAGGVRADAAARASSPHRLLPFRG